MKRFPLPVWVGVLLGALLAAPGRAQQGAQPPVRAGLEAAFSEGLQALEAGDPEQATVRLETIFEEDATFFLPGQGSAAYWLGRAYEAAGDPESVREVWREGFDALSQADLFDPRLADAFVRLTFAGGHGSDYPPATQAYLQLLGSVDRYPYAGETAALVREHLRALALILPEAVQRQAGLDRLEQEGLPALTGGAGARLLTWWRSQDVAPATRNNERLEEHLRRAVYAGAHYRDKDGFDDRGRVYIRLGAPSRTKSISFDDTSFRNKVIDRNLTINSFDFPDNEFWYYEHIDDAAQFLFVQQGDRFRLGEVSDLLPATLRGGLGNSERGLHKARAAVRTLEQIYRQLSLYHPAFGPRYQDVAAFASLLDESEIAAQTARQFKTDDQAVEGAGSDDVTQAIRDAVASIAGPDYSDTSLPGGSFPVNRPDLFAQSFLMQGHAEDEQLSIHREEYVPRSYSNTFDEVEPLPVIARLARFLDPDGTTRTEVYWGVPPGALQPSNRMRKRLHQEGYEAGDYLLLTTLVQQTEDYRQRVVNYRRYVLRDLEEAGDVALAPQVYTAAGDTGTYHVAMQWDQYTTTLSEQGQPITLGMAVKSNTFRSDSLRALSGDQHVLEMSDLKPMAVLDQEQAARADDLVDAAALYPFAEIDTETPLLLYFEVYHLAFGADDRTRFTVEYEMTRRTGGTLLRRGKEDRTSATTDYAGTSRTARESILLDLAEWEGSGQLDVVVRVTDRVTDRQVERILPFTFVQRK